jgi:hypothetical protein
MAEAAHRVLVGDIAWWIRRIDQNGPAEPHDCFLQTT